MMISCHASAGIFSCSNSRSIAACRAMSQEVSGSVRSAGQRCAVFASSSRCSIRTPARWPRRNTAVAAHAERGFGSNPSRGARMVSKQNGAGQIFFPAGAVKVSNGVQCTF
jgi:hypothetical protein